MGAIQEFDIFLDDSLEVYHSGETLTGHVALTLTKDLAMKGIRVSLRGEARTQWRESSPPVAFRSRRGALVRSVDPFLCHRMTVWGKEPEDTSEIPLLAAGQYTFPFQFTLPNQPGLPCSFECGRLACIRFYVQATIDISWAVDPMAERYFTFIGSETDVNSPKFTKSVQASDRKSMRWRCHSSGPIALKAEMQRSGYCSGEYINIRTRLENNSDKPMKLRVKMLQNVNLMASSTKRHSRKGSYEVLTYTSPPVLPEQEYVLQTARMLQIPLLPPTIDCQLIRVRYVIKVSLLVDEKPELNILFPTTIGNVPFKGKDSTGRQISYGYACQRSCGGNSDTVTYNDGDKVFNLKPFTPLYLTVFPIYDTTLSPRNGAVVGGLYRNGTVNGVANGGLVNGGPIQNRANGIIPSSFHGRQGSRNRSNCSPMHADSINSEIEETITISNQSACNVTKVNARMPATQLSRMTSEASGSTPSGSLRNSQESIIDSCTEKRNGVNGVDNRGFTGSTDGLSRTDILIHPDIHAEDNSSIRRSTRTANGITPTHRKLTNSASVGTILNNHHKNDISNGVRDSRNRNNPQVILTSSTRTSPTPNGGISLVNKGGRRETALIANKDPETGQLEIPANISPARGKSKDSKLVRNENGFIPPTEVERFDTISPDLVQGSPKLVNRRRLNFKRSSDNRHKVYASAPRQTPHQRSNSDDSTFSVSTISGKVHPQARIPEERYKRSATFTHGQSDVYRYAIDRYNGNIERNSLSSNASSCSDNQADSRNSVSPDIYTDDPNYFPDHQHDERSRFIQNSLPYNYNIQSTMSTERGRKYTEVTNQHFDEEKPFRDTRNYPDAIALGDISAEYPAESFSLTL